MERKSSNKFWEEKQKNVTFTQKHLKRIKEMLKSKFLIKIYVDFKARECQIRRTYTQEVSRVNSFS